MAIAVSLESGGQDGNAVRRFRIANNRIVRKTVTGSYGILVGNVSGPEPKGNVFADIVIEGNQFEAAEGLACTEPAIYLQASWTNAPEQHPFFDAVRVSDNTVRGGGASDTGIR